MKTSTKIIIGIGIVAVVVFGVFVGFLLVYPFFQRIVDKEDTAVKQQLAVNVTIQYSYWWGGAIINKYGTIEPDPGKVFLSVDMIIKNNGYDSFSTDPSYFFVIVERLSGDVKYGYEPRAYNSELWNNTVISSGETFIGRLHFQISDSWLRLKFEYKTVSGDFNVVWYKKS